MEIIPLKIDFMPEIVYRKLFTDSFADLNEQWLQYHVKLNYFIPPVFVYHGFSSHSIKYIKLGTIYIHQHKAHKKDKKEGKHFLIENKIQYYQDTQHTAKFKTKRNTVILDGKIPTKV